MKHMKLGLQEEPFLKSKSSATAQEKAGKTVWAGKKLVTGKKQQCIKYRSVKILKDRFEQFNWHYIGLFTADMQTIQNRMSYVK